MYRSHFSLLGRFSFKMITPRLSHRFFCWSKFSNLPLNAACKYTDLNLKDHQHMPSFDPNHLRDGDSNVSALTQFLREWGPIFVKLCIFVLLPCG